MPLTLCLVINPALLEYFQISVLLLCEGKALQMIKMIISSVSTFFG